MLLVVLKFCKLGMPSISSLTWLFRRPPPDPDSYNPRTPPERPHYGESETRRAAACCRERTQRHGHDSSTGGLHQRSCCMEPRAAAGACAAAAVEAQAHGGKGLGICHVVHCVVKEVNFPSAVAIVHVKNEDASFKCAAAAGGSCWLLRGGTMKGGAVAQTCLLGLY